MKSVKSDYGMINELIYCNYIILIILR